MNTPAVFSVASKCFVDLGEQDYEELVSPEVWNAFLAEIAHAESGVLAERLAARELAALEDPPSFEEHGRFCRRHFTGGLPESAMPVESLYRPWRESGAANTGQRGMYRSESALYMESLIARLGMTVPQGYEAWPDHLALELDLLAVLLRSGCAQDARSFALERFGWLADYRQKLLRLADPQKDFYLALVDVLIDAVEVAKGSDAACGAEQ